MPRKKVEKLCAKCQNEKTFATYCKKCAKELQSPTWLVKKKTMDEIMPSYASRGV